MTNLSGWLFMVAIAGLSSFASKAIVLGGKNPVEAAVIAIIVGLLLRHFSLIPKICQPGVKAFEKPLILGIVLIGASLNFTKMASQGIGVLTVVLLTMLAGFLAVYTLGRMLSLSKNLAILLTLGTTICGGTAIAISAPLLKAKEEETSYAIGTIALWGLAAILLYPTIARYFGVSDFSFGVFAGTAIHSTPQVVGAGFIYSDLSGTTATAVKLVRNCFLAPVVFCIAIYSAREAKSDGQAVSRADILKAFPWFLFGYFILAGLNTAALLPEQFVSTATVSGKFLILVGMVGVGLNSNLRAIGEVGYRPLIVGFLGALVVASASILGIQLLL